MRESESKRENEIQNSLNHAQHSHNIKGSKSNFCDVLETLSHLQKYST